MLKPPKDDLGYTQKEIIDICKERKISLKKFNTVFGRNTCAIGKDGKPRYYICDVQRTLYDLRNEDGIYHPWD
jgi:hypothetical protein